MAKGVKKLPIPHGRATNPIPTDDRNTSTRLADQDLRDSEKRVLNKGKKFRGSQAGSNPSYR